ncbi:inositol monophosphatase family protein [Mesorhizobium sophorae]|uniref:inositol monophosphatase family protein n=1 Tax=Mesorhizobium sophorae TaxID=1300294 RepID=UPI000BA4B537|nr:3'(2'),5'-bisphosphate nucleotidase CysQ [Mesorhizobium sophorae]
MDLFKAHALLISAAREAGLIALKFFRTRDINPSSKPDQSPVTAADLAIDAYLIERLTSFCPDIGWLSEERPDSADRLSKRRVWIVDPIDGTRGFLAESDEWVISLALVEDGRPVAAVLFRPATDDLYDAVLGGGSCLNGQRLSVSDGPLESIRIFTGPKKILQQSASEMPRAIWLRSSASLALRIALLASGTIDTALVKAGARDWDLAAADLILSEAGGCLTTSDGAGLVYNRSWIRHPALVSAGPRRHAALVSAFRTGILHFN